MIQRRTLYEAMCDECGFVATFYADGTAGVWNRLDAERHLRECGWKLGKTDRCPHCASEREVS